MSLLEDKKNAKFRGICSLFYMLAFIIAKHCIFCVFEAN